MDRLAFQFKDDHERVQACHEREKVQTWMDEHVTDFISLHKKVQHYKNALTTSDLKLLDILLQNTVSDIFHKRADQDFLLRLLEEKG